MHVHVRVRVRVCVRGCAMSTYLEGNVRRLHRQKSIAVAIYNFACGEGVAVNEEHALLVQIASGVANHV